jgi:hypothetical protein
MVRQVADAYFQLTPVPRKKISEVPSKISEVPRSKPSPALPAAAAAKFTGEYYSQEIDSTYQVIIRQSDSSLVIRRPNYDDTLLEPGSPGLFRIKGVWPPGNSSGLVLFTQTTEGKINGFTLTGFRGSSGQARIRDFSFKKM